MEGLLRTNFIDSLPKTSQGLLYKNIEAASDLRKAVAGAVSGAISKTVVAPLTRLTILYQVQGFQDRAFVMLPLHRALMRVIEKQGVFSLWRGNLVSVIHRIPNQAIGFYVQENSRDALDPFFRQDASGDFFKGLISGTIAGTTSCFLTYPLDTIRTRLAADLGGQKINHLLPMIHKQIMTEGMQGIFRGVGIACLQVAPAAALHFAVYDTLKMQWLERNKEAQSIPPLVSLVLGGLGGIVASTFTHPLDVVRKGLQVQGMGGMKMASQYGGFQALFMHILRQQGIRGLYAGIYPEYIKVFISAGLNFCVYETMKTCMGVPTRHRQPEKLS
eukprot:TRINITY_DN17349_c0_g1_i1.p1 TRINITY_DN17349_c0_g1~~TRINITY_DN17349_c0_g1_i1.p1  ORF type:complete len:331 (+),score=18.46 TRINITY_DN17349_c0_g1_i1:124-1116(+)